DAYSINRLTNFCGRWIKHCGWYPDKKVRLLNRNKGKWGGQNPHDKIIMDKGAKTEHLEGDLLHYSFDSLDDHYEQIEKFSTIAAESLYQKDIKPIPFYHFQLKPFFVFIKKYVFQFGFMDGKEGYLISKNSAYAKRLRYVKLKGFNQS
ncbi:MAG: hypothetical protein ABEH43_05400, partial [Flavobacteriales bacterium]